MKSLSLMPANRQEMNPGSDNDSKLPIKVALVDDDHNELALMTRAMAQSPDLETVGSFNSGLEALKGIPSSASEVVLMDVRMPGRSGIETTKRLKDVRPSLFIIMISGFDDPHTAERAREAGADAFLIKPLSLGRFFEALVHHREKGHHSKQRGEVRSLARRQDITRKLIRGLALAGL